ncbi:hypothetical protein FGO68_gene5298 [Halteria grandinella]|uniref:Uncharacterized protein n=1 Tax=Halteria grandinella TaxID=5974 RepID=A0A8J8NVV4_HALGN|nr:hypothetical protein FGO68_gene5298 [Halteria grandinella]
MQIVKFLIDSALLFELIRLLIFFNKKIQEGLNARLDKNAMMREKKERYVIIFLVCVYVIRVSIFDVYFSFTTSRIFLDNDFTDYHTFETAKSWMTESIDGLDLITALIILYLFTHYLKRLQTQDEIFRKKLELKEQERNKQSIFKKKQSKAVTSEQQDAKSEEQIEFLSKDEYGNELTESFKQALMQENKYALQTLQNSSNVVDETLSGSPNTTTKPSFLTENEELIDKMNNHIKGHDHTPQFQEVPHSLESNAQFHLAIVENETTFNPFKMGWQGLVLQNNQALNKRMLHASSREVITTSQPMDSQNFRATTTSEFGSLFDQDLSAEGGTIISFRPKKKKCGAENNSISSKSNSKTQKDSSSEKFLQSEKSPLGLNRNRTFSKKDEHSKK